MDVQHITRGSKPKAGKRQATRGESGGHPAEPAPSALTGDGSPAPSDAYNPADHTVTDVMEWVANHPDQRAAVLEAEQAGKKRTTLVTALEGSH